LFFLPPQLWRVFLVLVVFVVFLEKQEKRKTKNGTDVMSSPKKKNGCERSDVK